MYVYFFNDFLSHEYQNINKASNNLTIWLFLGLDSLQRLVSCHSNNAYLILDMYLLNTHLLIENFRNLTIMLHWNQKIRLYFLDTYIWINCEGSVLEKIPVHYVSIRGHLWGYCHAIIGNTIVFKFEFHKTTIFYKNIYNN